MDQTAVDHDPLRQDKNRSVTPDVESHSSIDSDETQTGVKNIEAVSQTWTQLSLIVAYIGSVFYAPSPSSRSTFDIDLR